MDLDFKTIRALSSPTRIKILSHSLKNEATPTNTADKIGKSKSTVSSHLEKLVEAGLLDRDEKEGRKRVVYQPTRKAEAIVEGRERKVKFSVASSAITGLTGIGLLYPIFQESGSKWRQASSTSSDANIMMESEMTRNTAERGLEATLSDPFLFLSAGFMIISLSALCYGLVLRSLEA